MTVRLLRAAKAIMLVALVLGVFSLADAPRMTHAHAVIQAHAAAPLTFSRPQGLRATIPSGCVSVYTVQAGDVLWRIALRRASTVAALTRLNQLSNPNLIFPAERLCIAVAAPPAPPVYHPPAPSSPSGSSPNHYPYGWCTWAAAHLAHDNVDGFGDAWHWLIAAQARGLPTGTLARVGATVVFQPGVDGASRWGHVAHVVRVYADGSFDATGMAQPTWGAWTTWHHRIQWGVAFIY